MKTYLKIITVFAFCFSFSLQNAFSFVIDEKPEKGANLLNIIVIDAGHGGKDSGARGRKGLLEKDITLKVALALKKDLEKKFPKSKIFLTRKDDTYLSLEERTNFANEKRADIFVSIHVNAARREGARGIETFFLSLDASDDEARRVAAFENEVVKFDKEETKDLDDDDFLQSIIWDMVQAQAHKESSKLAELVQTSLSKAMKAENRGVKQAPFYVLMGATMPAILVEVGFISNRKEERRLKNIKIQKHISKAIARGVVSFESFLKKTVGTKELGAITR